MDLSKTCSIATDYKDRRESCHWQSRIMADIVLIDKTDNSGKPVAYQIKHNSAAIEQFVEWRGEFTHLSKDCFILSGEVESIDRKKKQVILGNSNVLSYNHLVIATGSKNFFAIDDEQFNIGLQALIDALRVKSKIPSSFEVNLKKFFSPKEPRHAFCNTPSDSNPAKVLHPYITANAQCYSSVDLHSINKPLFEVQL